MPEPSEQTDALLAAAVAGDEQALMQLLFYFHQPLKLHIETELGDNLRRIVSADDILQETLVSAMRGIKDQQQPDADALLAWLRTIASNRIRDAARRESSKKRGGEFARVQSRPDPYRSHAGDLLAELSADSMTASRLVAREEAVDAMQVALAALPDDQREAVQLHCFERLTLEETATAMQRTTGSVRGLIQRAKQQLREQMQRSSMWLSGG